MVARGLNDLTEIQNWHSGRPTGAQSQSRIRIRLHAEGSQSGFRKRHALKCHCSGERSRLRRIRRNSLATCCSRDLANVLCSTRKLERSAMAPVAMIAPERGKAFHTCCSVQGNSNTVIRKWGDRYRRAGRQEENCWQAAGKSSANILCSADFWWPKHCRFHSYS
jgi:hypothetical protein